MKVRSTLRENILMTSNAIEFCNQEPIAEALAKSIIIIIILIDIFLFRNQYYSGVTRASEFIAVSLYKIE